MDKYCTHPGIFGLLLHGQEYESHWYEYSGLGSWYV